MRAVVAREPGPPDVLEVRMIDEPDPVSDEVLVEVAATAVNRADLMQRQGHYPPPPGASDILGLECSGTVTGVGSAVDRWTVGDRVCALLTSGGYADHVAVPQGQLLPVPESLDLVDAAALPEVICTVWSNVFMLAGLRTGELLLVHGGGGGIGTMAIQLAHAVGARVATTVGSAEKAAVCRTLGAELAINYRDQDFVDEVRALGGADVILDNMGAKYLARNIDALAPNGRLMVIGMQGGARAELDLGTLMGRRGGIFATTLRARPATEKAAIVAAVEADAWPLVVAGRVKPVVHTRLPLERAAQAHALVEAGTNVGKVLLTT
jgi:putative PIG3 family NAD(P)H quinone oxidoreductase